MLIFLVLKCQWLLRLGNPNFQIIKMDHDENNSCQKRDSKYVTNLSYQSLQESDTETDDSVSKYHCQTKCASGGLIDFGKNDTKDFRKKVDHLIETKETSAYLSKIQHEQLMSSSFSVRHCGISYKRKFYFEAQISSDDIRQSITPISKPIQRKKLLIVDNAKSNVKILHRLLEMQGHYCEVAVNGLIAVHMVNATLDMTTDDLYLRNYDAILMNLIMPVMDGGEATKEIRKLGYSGPIIGMTAGILHDDMDIFMDAGTTLVLPKPLDLHELYNVINHFTSHATQ